MPAKLWSMSGEMATFMTDGFRRQPSKQKVMLVRLAVLALLALMAPVALLFGPRLRRSTPFDSLYGRAREIGQTSPDDALALLRSAFETLLAGSAFAQVRPVEIAPFGRFKIADAIAVYRVLYDYEFSLGHFEEALAVVDALPGRLDISILQKVDCLVALGRKSEAIALLEGNLDLDSWRGKLRRRLLELGGRHLRALQ